MLNETHSVITLQAVVERMVGLANVDANGANGNSSAIAEEDDDDLPTPSIVQTRHRRRMT
jgi:hypothetical protein